MKQKFSKTWNRSVQPRKQRKYVYNAPLHVKGNFLSVHLSKELRESYKTRSVRVRVGDKVRVLRGSHKGEEQKVERVSLGTTKVYLEKIEVTKKDGSKAKIPFNPSNLLITSLVLDDKKRLQKLKGEQ